MGLEMRCYMAVWARTGMVDNGCFFNPKTLSLSGSLAAQLALGIRRTRERLSVIMDAAPLYAINIGLKQVVVDLQAGGVISGSV